MISEPQDKEKNISILDENTVVLWIPEYVVDSVKEYKLLTDYISKGFVIADIHKISNDEHKYNNWKKLKLEKINQ